ncbi:MAG: hypothetical protein ABI639_07100 [Thermoanaerobaculia bacterium]
MSRIALVHPLTLLGKEISERLSQRPDLCSELRLFAIDESMIGTLTAGVDGAAIVGRVEEDSFERMDLVILAGEAALDRRALTSLPASARAVIASRGASIEDGVPAIAGVAEEAWTSRDRLLAPSAAVVGLTRLLAPLRGLGLRRAVATIALPVSADDARGIDTLLEETRAVLAFAKSPKLALYPAQIAFNLLPGKLAGAEIAREVEAALDLAGVLVVQTVQAAVFHAVGCSLFVELDRPLDPAALRKLLAKSSGISAVKATTALGPVQAAGEEKLLLGDVQPAGANGFWIWAAIDNLTVGGAANVLEIASRLLGVSAPN